MVALQILDQATQRLVEQFAPNRIIQFGSQARGKAAEARSMSRFPAAGPQTDSDGSRSESVRRIGA